MSRPSRVTLLTALPAVIAVVAVVVILSLRSSPGVARPADSTRPASAGDLVAVTALLGGLPARLAAGDASVLTPGAVTRYRDVRSALPPGATLTPIESSWHRSGSVGSITVVVAAPGAAPSRYVVILIHGGSGWQIADTQPLGSSS